MSIRKDDFPVGGEYEGAGVLQPKIEALRNSIKNAIVRCDRTAKPSAASVCFFMLRHTENMRFYESASALREELILALDSFWKDFENIAE